MGFSFWGNGGAKKRNRTVNIFLGFFFVVNFCLGTGFLGIPYAFFYSGYVATIPTLLFIVLIGWANANYLLEVMARAQALEYFKHSQNPASDSETTDSEIDQVSPSGTFLQQSLSPAKHHPKFEITIKRKFEISELCELFVNRYLKYTYLVVFSVYSFLASWSFSTVAASAWAINIPFRNFGGAEQCAENAFLHNVLPAEGCLYTYYFCLMMFAVIVVTLSLFDLKEQAVVQMVLGLLRFFTVGAIIIYCIVRLAEGGDACRDESGLVNTTHNVEISSVVLRFDPSGWLLAIPVFTYAFMFHTGIASLTHPIKQKKYLHWLMVAMFVASTTCYMSLGVIVPLWFRATIQETCTLNWAVLTRPGHSVSIRVLSYYLIFFPSVDVISAYPLVNHALVNNLYILITGHDTSRKPKYRFDWFLRIFLRFTMALLPILAAFGVANLIYILKYAGLVGFIAYLFPVGLQLRSIQVCKRKFATSFISISRSLSVIKEIDEKKVESNEEEEPASDADGHPGGKKKEEKESLLEARDLNSKEKQALYMTPYSNVLISHPISAWIIAGIGACLFLLAFASLFIHPHKLFCEYGY